MSAKIHDAIRKHMESFIVDNAADYFHSAQLMKIPSFTLDKKAIDEFIFGYRNVNAGKIVTETGKPVKVEGEYISTKSPFEKTFYYFDKKPLLTTFINIFSIYQENPKNMFGCFYEEPIDKEEGQETKLYDWMGYKSIMEKQGLRNPLSLFWLQNRLFNSDAWAAEEDTGIFWDFENPKLFDKFFDGEFVVFADEIDFKDLELSQGSLKEGFAIEAFLFFLSNRDQKLYQIFDHAVVLEYEKKSDVIYKHHATYMRKVKDVDGHCLDPLEAIWAELERQQKIFDATKSTQYFFGKGVLAVDQIELVLYHYWWITEITIKKTLEIFSCKNIIADKIELPAKVVKQRKKKNKPEFSSYTLKIDPTTSPKSMDISTATESLWNNRLHTCRGHVREYGMNGKGKLFGKYSGRFWSPPHQRGNRENGVIEKDYDVQSLT